MSVTEEDWAWDVEGVAEGGAVTFLDIYATSGQDGEIPGTLACRGRHYSFVVTGTGAEDRVLWEVNTSNGWAQGTWEPDTRTEVRVADTGQDSDWREGTVEEVLADGRLRVSVEGLGVFIASLPDFIGEPETA